MTLSAHERLRAEVVEVHPEVTKTALVARGRRALLSQFAYGAVPSH
jgi:hypothetical protein